MLKDSFKEIGKKVTPPTGFRLVEVDTFEPDILDASTVIKDFSSLDEASHYIKDEEVKTTEVVKYFLYNSKGQSISV